MQGFKIKETNFYPKLNSSMESLNLTGLKETKYLSLHVKLVVSCQC